MVMAVILNIVNLRIITHSRQTRLIQNNQCTSTFALWSLDVPPWRYERRTSVRGEYRKIPCRDRDWNRWPPAYQSNALPTELSWLTLQLTITLKHLQEKLQATNPINIWKWLSGIKISEFTLWNLVCCKNAKHAVIHFWSNESQPKTTNKASRGSLKN